VQLIKINTELMAIKITNTIRIVMTRTTVVTNAQINETGISPIWEESLKSDERSKKIENSL
jgi:hypothetical protein